MKNPLLKKALPHLLAIGVALVVILFYFNPMLTGKSLKQNDVDQWRATYEETAKFQKESGERTFWTNSVFSGMPNYLIGPTYEHNFTNTLLFNFSKYFKNPFDTLLLLFICFYILLLAFDVQASLAIVGSLAFMLSSFNFINIDAGHVGKGNAIAFMPLVLAGIQITLRKNKLFGALLTGIAMSLQLAAGHLQITYYLVFIVIAWLLAELIMAIKNKQIGHLMICGLYMAIATGLGVATSATSLMATEEYGKYSIRGKSELSKTVRGESNEENTSSGLDKSYALDYSYLPLEPLTILIPNMFGGAQYGNLSTSSDTYAVLKQNQVPNPKQIIQNMPLYWGDQPFTAGPTYYGAIICFLFLLGMLLYKGNEKWWILAISLVAVFLSMGKHFMWFTDLFFNYVPLYNKFRSVTFILAITQTTFPLLAMLVLRDVFNGKLKKEEVMKKALLSFYIVGGLCALFYIAPELLFNVFGIPKGENIADYFVSRSDAQLPEWLRDSIAADRKSILRMDALRALIFIALSLGGIWAYVHSKIKLNVFIGLLALLITVDLWQIDKRYVNESDFEVKKKNKEVLFAKTEADQYILQDKDLSYRVYNTTQRLDQDAITSYYHKSIGGYHGAKMRRYQELISFQLSKNNFEVINMLNVKYFILADSLKNLVPQLNPEANGNAWFVKNYTMVENADAELDSLSNFKSKETAIIDKRYSADLNGFKTENDSTARIQLTLSQPNKLVYTSSTNNDQLAVFSEIFYDKGWNAYVDGKLVPHFRCNYVLRGMIVPAGKHTIEYKFEPSVVAQGETISLISSLLLYGGIIIIGGIRFIKKKKEEPKS